MQGSIGVHPQTVSRRFLDKLNSQWHEKAMWIFTVIVIGHWAEHLVQAFQIYVLHWPVKHALGVLGMVWPVLVHSEVLHYAYALVMLVGFLLLRPGMRGKSLVWWNVALAVQMWHHFEHALLFGQAAAHHPLFGSPVPISLVQLVIPRVELHLIYNAIVTVPMTISMIWHLYPPVADRRAMVCTCARHRVA